jgi:hypothetical protein
MRICNQGVFDQLVLDISKIENLMTVNLELGLVMNITKKQFEDSQAFQNLLGLNDALRGKSEQVSL